MWLGWFLPYKTAVKCATLAKIMQCIGRSRGSRITEHCRHLPDSRTSFPLSEVVLVRDHRRLASAIGNGCSSTWSVKLKLGLLKVWRLHLNHSRLLYGSMMNHLLLWTIEGFCVETHDLGKGGRIGIRTKSSGRQGYWDSFQINREIHIHILPCSFAWSICPLLQGNTHYNSYRQATSIRKYAVILKRNVFHCQHIGDSS